MILRGCTVPVPFAIRFLPDGESRRFSWFYGTQPFDRSLSAAEESRLSTWLIEGMDLLMDWLLTQCESREENVKGDWGGQGWFRPQASQPESMGQCWLSSPFPSAPFPRNVNATMPPAHERLPQCQEFHTRLSERSTYASQVSPSLSHTFGPFAPWRFPISKAILVSSLACSVGGKLDGQNYTHLFIFCVVYIQLHKYSRTI